MKALAWIGIVAIVGCGGEAANPPEAIADVSDAAAPPEDVSTQPVSTVHVAASAAVVSAGAAYVADEPRQYRTTAELPNLDVRALYVQGDAVLAATAGGVVTFDAAKDRFTTLVALSAEPARDVTKHGAFVVALYSSSLEVLNSVTGEVETVALPGLDPVTVASADGSLVVGAAQGLFRVEAGTVTPMKLIAGAVTDLAEDEGAVFVASAGGVFRGVDDLWLEVDASPARAVATSPEGPWAGDEQGVQRFDANLALPAGLGGLPTGDVVGLAVGKDGTLAVAHAIGASRVDLGKSTQHYAGARWLPSDDVRAVAIDGKNRLWIGTAAGITRIDNVNHTLTEKAKAMDDLLDQRFWRRGFASPDAHTDDAWTPATWTTDDSDNDGLWTEMQIGAWCFAYAVTGDEAYYQRARKAMDTMFLLIDVPAVDFEKAGLGRGFIARSLVRDDEGALFASKSTQSNWHLVHLGEHDYYWKDDTSSDETTGHFFGMPLFYDLCAKDHAERAAVADHAGALAGTILDNGYLLIDLDGKETLHGHWQPERIAAAVNGLDQCEARIEWCVESWGGGGWLNALEILGHLLAAWHMTGEARFYDAYDELVTTHRYDLVAMTNENTLTVTEAGAMNHSDHELAILSYHTLIRYEPNADRRAKWIESLLGFYEHEKPERNPFLAAMVALAAGGEHAELEAALTSLREMPFDRRKLALDNSHRKDAGDGPPDRFGDPQFDRVFPYDEIRAAFWNKNLYAKSGGGDGREVSTPMAWLLPYWALRYAGAISE